MKPYVQDPDFTLYVGDVREVLAGLPDESVQCVVTSPPYWGLRDYGTGSWEGGDPDCDHAKPTTTYNHGFNERWGQGAGERKQEKKSEGQYAQVCGKCSARRVDRQLGLEPTPEMYVENMVAVFREVRRVLRKDGTCWLNIGDSYATGTSADRNPTSTEGPDVPASWAGRSQSIRRHPANLKPKDLCGIPWRLAFALQADGWYLRSEIIWAKPNPMPESVTDRPTKSHEQVFLLTRSPRYFYDADAVREEWSTKHMPGARTSETHHYGAGNGGNTGLTAHRQPFMDELRRKRHAVQKETLDGSEGEAPRGPDGRRATAVKGGDGSIQHRDGERWPNAGRNLRSVWEIATEPFPEAHFATYPQALVERCVKAGTAESDVVLDPFGGSGTTALVARRLGRKSVLVELNESYAEMASRRLSQQSLLADVA